MRQIMKFQSKYMLLSICILVMVLIAGCGEQQAVASSSLPPTDLSIQLGWTYDYSLSGFYAAEKNGHFASQNLNVKLEEGGFVNGKYVDPVGEVLNGTATFGLSDTSSIILARSQGKPVVGLMAILQHSPNAVISLADKKLARPQDLVGHTVAVADGGATTVFLSLLKSQNIDPKSIN